VDPTIAMVATMAVAAMLAFGLYFGSGMHTFVAKGQDELAPLA
jgi:hypothetical protein